MAKPSPLALLHSHYTGKRAAWQHLFVFYWCSARRPQPTTTRSMPLRSRAQRTSAYPCACRMSMTSPACPRPTSNISAPPDVSTPRALRAHGAVKIQAVGPAVERHAAARAGPRHVEAADFAAGDIGRVAQNELKPPQRIGENGCNASRCEVAARPPTPWRVRFLRATRSAGSDRSARTTAHLNGQVFERRDADAAGPAAQIEQAAARTAAQEGNAALDQRFGVRPGDEGVGGHLEGQAVKVPLPDDVGQRHAAQAAPPSAGLISASSSSKMYRPRLRYSSCGGSFSA